MDSRASTVLVALSTGAEAIHAHTAGGVRLTNIAITVLLVALAVGVIAALVARARGSAWKSRRVQGFVIGACIAAVIAGLLLIFT